MTDLLEALKATAPAQNKGKAFDRLMASLGEDERAALHEAMMDLDTFSTAHLSRAFKVMGYPTNSSTLGKLRREYIAEHRGSA